MYKFVVLFAVIAVASSAPSPGFLHGGYHGYPAATSYSSRVDIHHSKPIIATYAAPIVKTIVAEPIISKTIVAEPIHSYGYSSGLGLGHGYDLGHSYGLSSVGYGHGIGLGHGLGYGHGYGHGW